jgi:TetR/AcrR family transcriptional repressor of nem operon
MGRISDAKERLMEAVSELFWTGSYDSTTIDQICERAGVKKGSFYYFFDGKSELAEAALDQEWQKYRPELDALFSASVEPLERLRNFCDHTYREQVELKARHGFVLGCPLCTLGSEVSTQEQGLRKKVQEIMDQHLKYLEAAIRDAHAAGLIHAPDPKAKARMLHAYHLGLMTEARIKNSLEVFSDTIRGTWELLGVKDVEPTPA